MEANVELTPMPNSEPPDQFGLGELHQLAFRFDKCANGHIHTRLGMNIRQCSHIAPVRVHMWLHMAESYPFGYSYER